VRRLGAAIIAVLMVVGALWVRGRIDDDGGGGGSTSDGVIRLRCATELKAACTDLSDENGDVEVTFQDPGETLDELVAVPDTQRGNVGFDAWLVPAPWPQMVDAKRAVDGLEPIFVATSAPIARSPLVLVVRSNREPVLEATAECAGTVTWKCIGQVAGRPWDSIGGESQWGRVKPGHGDPTESGAGLLVLSQASSDFLRSLGVDEYDRFDLQDNDDYGDWLSTLERAVPDLSPIAGSPFLDMVQKLPTAVYDVTGTTEAEAGPAIADADPDRRRQVTLLYPEPVVTADVVLATVVGADTGAIADLATSDDLRSALASNGWRVPGEPRVKGVRSTPALPSSNGLPDDPGALIALQDTFETAG
jgi:Bacterial extracellular solute-binding protein